MGIDYRNSLPPPSDRFESHEAWDQRLREALARFDRETQVGWPIQAGAVAIVVIAVAMLFYLFICPSLLRWPTSMN
jgi:hypothetical protein